MHTSSLQTNHTGVLDGFLEFRDLLVELGLGGVDHVLHVVLPLRLEVCLVKANLGFPFLLTAFSLFGVISRILLLAVVIVVLVVYLFVEEGRDVADAQALSLLRRSRGTVR